MMMMMWGGIEGKMGGRKRGVAFAAGNYEARISLFTPRKLNFKWLSPGSLSHRFTDPPPSQHGCVFLYISTATYFIRFVTV